jgi:hypothetical protein
VTLDDRAMLLARYRSMEGDGVYDALFDLDLDGRIDAVDYYHLRERIGRSL